MGDSSILSMQDEEEQLDEQGWLPLLLLGPRQHWSGRKGNLDVREWSPFWVTAQSPSNHLQGHGTNHQAVRVRKRCMGKRWSVRMPSDGGGGLPLGI